MNANQPVNRALQALNDAPEWAFVSEHRREYLATALQYFKDIPHEDYREDPWIAVFLEMEPDPGFRRLNSFFDLQRRRYRYSTHCEFNCRETLQNPDKNNH